MQNYIVLITGASSGIGAACAKIFAHAGAKLILAARRWERLQQLADSLDIASDKIHLLVRVEGGYYPALLSVRSGRATFTASGSRCS